MNTLLGCEQPRIWTPPLRGLNPDTSLGFAVIEFADEVLKIQLLPWQRWLAIHALELLPDGSFRFRTVVLLVARQSGKSTFLQVLALFFLYVRSAALIIGTAQNLDIAEEVWQGAVNIAQDVEELASEISRVNMTNGKKALELRTGERYKVQAANRRGGRGLSGDLVLLDELREHQSWDAWGAITKTTLARPLAMIWAASNAGDAASIVLRYLRKLAHLSLGDPDGLLEPDETLDDDEVSLDDSSLGIFEWSAEPGCSLTDRGGWAQANPSLGHTITERAISSALRTDPEWVFRTEVLCQWSDGTLEGPFPAGTWAAGIVKDVGADGKIKSKIVSEPVACVDVSTDRGWATITVAGFTAEGVPQVEVAARRAGLEWVKPWFLERSFSAVTGQTNGSPVSGLMIELSDAGLPVVPWAGGDVPAATGGFYDLVRSSVETAALLHPPHSALDIAAATAVPKLTEGGAFMWDRKRSPTDIAPLVAATGAVWLLTKPAAKAFVSYYETNAVEVI